MSDELCRAAFEMTSVGMCLADPLTGRLRRVNRGFCELTGQHEKDLLDQPFTDLLPAADRAAFMQEFTRLREGQITKLQTEQRLLRPEGNAGDNLWCEITVNLLRDAAGQPLSLVAVLQDITLRKQAEETASHYRAQFEAVFGAMQDGVIVADMTGHFVLANEAAAHINAFPSVAEMQKNLAFYVDNFRLAQLDGQPVSVADWPINKVLRGESVQDWELHAWRRDTGQQWFMSFSGEPVRDPQGNQVLALIVLRDITKRKTAEEQLRQSEEKFRLFIEHHPAAVAMFDREMRYLAVSPRWLQDYGLTSDVIGRNYYDVFPEIPARWKEVHRRCLAGAVEKTEEERFERADGSAEWLKWEVRPWHDRSGAIGGLIIHSEDITARKLAEIKLHESEMRTASIIDSALDAIITVDAAQRIVLFNPAAERMFKCPAAEALGQALDQFIPARYRGPHQEHHQEFSHSGNQHRSMNQRGNVWGLRANGEEFQLEASISQVAVNGEPFFTFIARDVTQRKQDEAQLREQTAMLDQAREAILIRDLAGHIRFWNQGAVRVYGWQADEVQNRSVEELFYRGDTTQLQAALQQLLEKGEWSGEIRQFTKAGRELTIEAHWTLIQDEQGLPKSILAINNDVTEKKKLESQFLRAQRLESLGTLAGGIAHDLNNILAPVLMGVQMLQMKLTEPDVQRWLEVMHGNVQRGADLIKQILLFARGVQGERVPLQLKHLIKETVKILRETFPKAIEIKFSLPDELPLVSGDATQLHQVLMNLCVNARDAMSTGGQLRIEALPIVVDQQYTAFAPDMPLGQYIQITVSDTGTGIPNSLKDKIFDPFFTTKALGKGTGLGLSTVLGIVKSHLGFINVYSEPGKGAKFILYLPAHTPAGMLPTVARPLDWPTGHGELVMVVDDEASVREITRTTLETFDYRVLTAGDGAEALAVYVQNHAQIGAVLIDMMMPYMDGPSTIRALQKLNPQIKIIASSGLAEQDRLQELASLGVRHFLPKPYTADRLLKALADLFPPTP